MIAAVVTHIKPGTIDRMQIPPSDQRSRPVTSNQTHTHPRLPEVLRRHLENAERKPVARHNREAFSTLLRRLEATPGPLVIDSFCGTGQSTALLATRHPGHLVVGIDRSASRLAKHVGSESGNYLLLHAECEPIWRLLAEAGIGAHYHYLLYPNPWPKAGHLQRRIHGHPGFAWLLQLGGAVELRSNWQIYVEEFGLAMQLAGHPGRVAMVPDPGDPGEDLTLFERKYRYSGHMLWSFKVELGPRTA